MGAEARGGRFHVINPQRKMSSARVAAGGSGASSDQVQFLHGSQAKPGAGKRKGRPRQLLEADHVAEKAHTGGDVGHGQGDMVQFEHSDTLALRHFCGYFPVRMASSPLPQVWDLTSYFPKFRGAEYQRFFAALRTDAETRLARASGEPALSEAAGNSGVWSELFNGWEDLAARLTHLNSYLECLSAAHADDEEVQSDLAALALIQAEVDKVKTQLLRGIGGASGSAAARLDAEPALAGAGFALGRLREEASRQMSPELENLAFDLGVDGFSAWGRLYDTISGKMEFEMAFPDGRRERVPMARRRALMADGERAVRQAAFSGGNRAWAGVADACAAALNALAGTRHTLYARRRHSDFLDAPLFDSALSRPALDAMFGAIADGYELSRRVLRAGARLQGTPALAWFDLEAPRPLAPIPRLTWEECVRLVSSAFARSYPALGKFFDRMIERRWIESEARPNKRGGGFLTSTPVIREQRIFMTFADTMHDVVTLAHEAGHAWHSHRLGGLRPCAQDYPMTLAETASTFAEHMLIHGLLADPALTADRRAFLVDTGTSRTPAYLLNIPVRFQFERRFYEERRAGIVSPSRLCELMVAAQREVYGDTLEPGQEDPWFWASKLHFFITRVSFYNFPYTFGYLLSQAMYAAYRTEGDRFLPRYEAFLAETGRATCEDAVRRTLGWDLRSREFWAEAIAACEPAIRDFEALANQRT